MSSLSFISTELLKIHVAVYSLEAVRLFTGFVRLDVFKAIQDSFQSDPSPRLVPTQKP